MTSKRSTGLAFVAGLALCVVMRGRQAPAVRVVEVPRPEPTPPTPAQTRRRTPAWRLRGATALAFTALFCAGGAFSAFAGDALVDDGTTVAADTTTTATTETTEEAAPPAIVETTPAETAQPVTAEPVAAEPAAAEPEPVVETVEADPTDGAAPARHVFEPTGAAPTPAPHATTPKPRRVASATARTKPATQKAAPRALPPFPVITFDPASWVDDHPATALGASAVTIAQQYLGVPYVWGGNTPNGGFDCSGLMQFVYAQLGVALPHYAAAQFHAYPHVDMNDLRPGDLVFFEPKFDGPGHVALYTGGDSVVEAPHTGAVVRVASLTGMAQRLGFLGGVRPQGGQPLPQRATASEARPFLTPSPL